MREPSWNQAAKGKSGVAWLLCVNAVVAARELVANTSLRAVRASAGICGRCGGGASHRKEGDTPSLVGSCRGTLGAP